MLTLFCKPILIADMRKKVMPSIQNAEVFRNFFLLMPVNSALTAEAVSSSVAP